MMAVCIYVFNCAPEMDYRSMGDIWKGLGASGGWYHLEFRVTTHKLFDVISKLINDV
jgi:hypothetical protein